MGGASVVASDIFNRTEDNYRFVQLRERRGEQNVMGMCKEERKEGS